MNLQLEQYEGELKKLRSASQLALEAFEAYFQEYANAYSNPFINNAMNALYDAFKMLPKGVEVREAAPVLWVNAHEFPEEPRTKFILGSTTGPQGHYITPLYLSSRLP